MKKLTLALAALLLTVAAATAAVASELTPHELRVATRELRGPERCDCQQRERRQQQPARQRVRHVDGGFERDVDAHAQHALSIRTGGQTVLRAT